ncbi:MAG: GNAT family N-acetyltransferase, partial [Planctomycetaceae bacterium]|nr:GNAT family N-acetyltransferase [Planctomycetaceae bacterium]
NLFVASVGKSIIGIAATREIRVAIKGLQLCGAMIGLVGIHCAVRHRGLGKILISRISEEIRARALDFAVLWTTSPNFYRQHGWNPVDTGVLGYLALPKPQEVCEIAESPKDLFDEIESTRKQWAFVTVSRRLIDYETTPASVDRVVCIRVGNRPNVSAYAIVGIRGYTGFVYEMIGNPVCFGKLWSRISGRFSELYVNDCPEASSYEWITSNTSLRWQSQNLAAWLSDENGLSSPMPYIPFFDRI